MATNTATVNGWLHLLIVGSDPVPAWIRKQPVSGASIRRLSGRAPLHAGRGRRAGRGVEADDLGLGRPRRLEPVARRGKAGTPGRVVEREPSAVSLVPVPLAASPARFFAQPPSPGLTMSCTSRFVRRRPVGPRYHVISGR